MSPFNRMKNECLKLSFPETVCQMKILAPVTFGELLSGEGWWRKPDAAGKVQAGSWFLLLALEHLSCTIELILPSAKGVGLFFSLAASGVRGNELHPPGEVALVQPRAVFCRRGPHSGPQSGNHCKGIWAGHQQHSLQRC